MNTDAPEIHFPLAFPLLSDATKALTLGQITVLSGNPGGGKSWFLLQNLIDLHDRGIPVAVLAFDASAESYLHHAKVMKAQDTRLFDAQWVFNNNEEAHDTFAAQEEWGHDFSRHIYSAPMEAGIGYAQQWISDMAAFNNVVVAVDPLRYPPSFAAMHEFILAARKTIQANGMSLILATNDFRNLHAPEAAIHSCGPLNLIAAAQTILYLECLRDHENPNRHLHILKSRWAEGQGTTLAYNFHGKTMTFTEEGILETTTTN